MSKGLIVAIDGPAGSGKSTSAKIIAKKLGYLYIDTGAMYRAITYLAIKNEILSNHNKIIELAKTSKIDLEFTGDETRVFVNGEELTNSIRTEVVNNHVSDLSKIRELRKVLVQKQRQMGKEKNGVVMEGRDITTVVFPDADVKIFLTASIDQRAERRAKEYHSNGMKIPLNNVKENLAKRDEIDSNRVESPLTQAPDATVIDTSEISVEDQVNLILKKVKEAAAKKGYNLEII